MSRIYLDHSASAPLDPRVREGIREWLLVAEGNPSSLHFEGRAARRMVEEARESVAALLGAEPGEIIFTSGASEANNLALKGRRLPEGGAPPSHLAVSTIEHPSILQPARELEREGRKITYLGVDRMGLLKWEELEGALQEGVGLVAVMWVNNEVGSIQDMAQIAQLCQNHGALLHVDAVQGAGWRPLQVRTWGPRTSLALSAHKLGGPAGVGALYLARENPITPQILGGSQERERRAGTENLPGILGFGLIARLAREELLERARKRAALEAVFMEALAEVVPKVRVHGPPPPRRLPGILNLCFPGVSAESLLFALDLEGVAVSVGSACSSGAAEPSHVLAAMGLSKTETLQSLRVSLGINHSHEELVRAAQIFGRVLETNFQGQPDF